jgi:hypothetical protein
MDFHPEQDARMAPRYCGSPTFRTQTGNLWVGTQGLECEVSFQANEKLIVFLKRCVEPLESLIFVAQVGIELSNLVRR